MTEYKQNLHTHTKFCDGANSPEDMVKKAIEIGFDTIGFSGHSNTKFDIDWHMTEEDTFSYIKEVNRLKREYSDRINIMLGLEYDMYSDTPNEGYDYLIGSVHFLKASDGYISFDESAETVKGIIETNFSGDGMAYAREYYAQLSRLHEYGSFDFVGHFDIVAKHCETHNFFDVESKEYRNAALSALRAVFEHHKVFEVNTGAIARGYRKTPYPAPFILKEMKNLGATVILTSDCHDANKLTCHYKDSIELIKSCGFDCVGVMKNGGFIEIKI